MSYHILKIAFAVSSIENLCSLLLKHYNDWMPTVYALHEQLQNISCSNNSLDEPLSQPRSCGTMSILQHNPVPKMNQCMTLDANALARSPLLSLYTQIQGLARPFYQTLGLANAA